MALIDQCGSWEGTARQGGLWQLFHTASPLNICETCPTALFFHAREYAACRLFNACVINGLPRNIMVGNPIYCH